MKTPQNPNNGCFIWILILVCTGIVIYLMVNDKSAETAMLEKQYRERKLNERTETSGTSDASIPFTKWSSKAKMESEDRVAKWKELDQIRLDLENNQVYISPLFWSAADAEQKKEIMITFIIYQDTRSDKDDNPITLLDKQSGKELASWSSFSGFEF